MQYFRNVDIVKDYHVDESTVRKWIRNAKAGKLDLVLYEKDGRSFIANTSKNIASIKEQVEAHRKFRNTKAAKVVTPRPEFYSLFTQAQIYDIVTDLELHHEIARQYNYVDKGASNWDKYTQRLAAEESSNLLTCTIELIRENQQYLDFLLGDYDKVNVVDIGVGNALPIRNLLAHLLEQEKLGRYIALDISGKMLQIAERNISTWFGGRVKFEGYETDINYERFAYILAEEYLKPDADRTANLILLFGGTLGNLRDPDGAFRVIRNSMGSHDFLLYSRKLDSSMSRRYFDFNPEPNDNSLLSPNHRFIFDLLNIDESFYEVEMGFDERVHQRYIRVRLKMALTIKFTFNAGERLLQFSKGDAILLWRSWQQSATDVARQFDHNDFYILHSSQTKDQEYMLTVSRAKTD
jgi:uncharacterized SAM-dependent methyltransferase